MIEVHGRIESKTNKQNCCFTTESLRSIALNSSFIFVILIYQGSLIHSSLTTQRMHPTSLPTFLPTVLPSLPSLPLTHSEQCPRKKDTWRDWGFGAQKRAAVQFPVTAAVTFENFHSPSTNPRTRGSRLYLLLRLIFTMNEPRYNKSGWENASLGLIFILLFWLYYSLAGFRGKWNEQVRCDSER